MLFHFLNLHVDKKTLAKAVACTMIFNTASTMTNLSLNSQNRLYSCSGIGLLIGFLVFHLIKINFVIPEACAIIFNTASLVNKFFKTPCSRLEFRSICYGSKDCDLRTLSPSCAGLDLRTRLSARGST